MIILLMAEKKFIRSDNDIIWFMVGIETLIEALFIPYLWRSTP